MPSAIRHPVTPSASMIWFRFKGCFSARLTPDAPVSTPTLNQRPGLVIHHQTICGSPTTGLGPPGDDPASARTIDLTSSPDRLTDTYYDGFLFDMDGTLLNSIAAAERVWSRWALRHGLDLETFLPKMHGKRGVDTIAALNLPGVDVTAEALEVERGEIEDLEGIVPLPGAIAFLNALPADRWAIVTSAPAALARARIGAAGLPQPQTIVTAEDVKIGKPDPAGYRLGAEKLGFNPTRCLVFEDVLAGVKAGEAAGADVVVVTGTHQHPLETDHPSIAGYEDLTVDVSVELGLRIRRIA